MKRHRQQLSELVTSLTPVDASWLDEHAEACIQLLQKLPAKSKYTRKDITELLDLDFSSASTVIRLFLDCSKDEMTMRMKETLGQGGIGIQRYQSDKDAYAKALITDGITWKERLSDLEKLVYIQNRGLIHRIYTRSMKDELLSDLKQIKQEFGL